jgi:Arc/MetJ family transcription regulator
LRTNILIDDKLMRDALRVAGLKTKKAEIRNLRGKLNWHGDLNAMRSDR